MNTVIFNLTCILIYKHFFQFNEYNNIEFGSSAERFTDYSSIIFPRIHTPLNNNSSSNNTSFLNSSMLENSYSNTSLLNSSLINNSGPNNSLVEPNNCFSFESELLNQKIL